MPEITSVPAIASYSILALLFAGLYLLVSTLGGNFADYLHVARRRKSPIPFDPGRFVHQESQFIGRHLRRHGTAALIFFATFAALLSVGRQDWWPQLPLWAWWTMAVAIMALFAYTQIRFLRLALYRRRLDGLHDDHVIVGHRLNEARARGYRIYHAVPMREGVIDHVVVGEKGLFAVQIISPPSKKFTSVRLEGDVLIFSPHNVEKGYRKISKYIRPAEILRKRLSETVGHDIKVMPIIVVTDCEIESSSERNCLLATPTSCIMFVGWNDPGAHLMDDEVQKVAGWLVGRCKANPFRRWRARVNNADIGYST